MLTFLFFVYMYLFRYKNGEIFHIQSLDSESITLSDVTHTDTAYYQCQAGSEFSTVTSRSVSISVQGYKKRANFYQYLLNCSKLTQSCKI